MLEDLFLLSSSHTIVFPSRFSSLLPIGPSYLPTLGTLSLGVRVERPFGTYYQTTVRYPYTGTSLVPRKLPTTVIMNTESSPVSPYSTWYPVTLLTGLPEPKTYTFKQKNKLLLKHLNDRAGILALALSSRRILAGEGTSVRQRMTTNAFPGSFVP